MIWRSGDLSDIGNPDLGQVCSSHRGHGALGKKWNGDDRVRWAPEFLPALVFSGRNA